jgi:hypothetical protein
LIAFSYRRLLLSLERIEADLGDSLVELIALGDMHERRAVGRHNPSAVRIEQAQHSLEGIGRAVGHLDHSAAGQRGFAGSSLSVVQECAKASLGHPRAQHTSVSADRLTLHGGHGVLDLLY